MSCKNNIFFIAIKATVGIIYKSFQLFYYYFIIIYLKITSKRPILFSGPNE